jgi:hypothetical protein
VSEKGANVKNKDEEKTIKDKQNKMSHLQI